MEAFLLILFGLILFIAIIVWGVNYTKTNKRPTVNDVENLISFIETEPLRINSDIKQYLESFSSQNSFDFNQFSAKELINLLSISAETILIFEKNIEQISNSYEQFYNRYPFFDDMLANPQIFKRINNRNPMIVDMKRRIDNQYIHSMNVFNEDLLSVNSVLSVIPEKYRMSIILYRFCEYLSEGEADSWKDCIRIFKEDVFRLQQNEKFDTMIKQLGRIEENTATIKRNTAATAFFSGISAWNSH